MERIFESLYKGESPLLLSHTSNHAQNNVIDGTVLAVPQTKYLNLVCVANSRKLSTYMLGFHLLYMAACNLSKQQQMFGLHMMGNCKGKES